MSGNVALVTNKGSWNALLNAPAISNSTRNNSPGDYYTTSVAGTSSFTSRGKGQYFAVGDIIVYNGAVWTKNDQFSVESGYGTPANWKAAYDDHIISGSFANNTITLNQKDGGSFTIDLTGVGGSSLLYRDTIEVTNTNGQNSFTLSTSIDHEDKTQVFIDGVYQQKTGYSVSGTTLTFDDNVVVPDGSFVEIISFSSVSLTDSLADAKVFIGNTSSVAIAKTISGDATLANTGALTLNTVPIAKGGTGATSASAARTSLGLGSVATTASTDYATAAQGTKADSAHGWGDHGSGGYITGITSSNVTTALGFTPYNATNPSSFITGITFANVSSKPTTLSGYGITDAAPIASPTFSGSVTAGGAVRINATTTSGLVIASSSGASNGLKLYNNSSTDNAYIYNHYNGNLEIGTNNATVLTMNGTSSTFSGNVRTNSSSTRFLAAYNSSDSYHGALSWNTLQLGSNGENRIVAGRTSTGASLKFYVNNTNDANIHTTTPDGILSLTLANTGAATFSGTVNVGSTLSVQANSSLATLELIGRTGSGFGGGLVAKSSIYSETSGSQYSANLVFKTNNGSNSLTERLRLNYNGDAIFSGDIQITTSSAPTLELIQSGSTNYVGLVKLNGNDLEIRGSSGVMEFYNGSVHGNSSALRMSISSGGLATFKSSYVVAGNHGGEVTVGGGSTAFGIAMKYNQSGATSGTIYCSPGYNNAATTLMLGTGSNTNQLVLKGDGKVGIGTTSPAHKLSVNQNTYASGSDAPEAALGITIGDYWTTSTGAALTIKNAGHRGAVGHVSGSPLFRADFNNATGMILDKNGNVGIGTASPSARLQVQGAINTSSGAAVVEVYTNLSSGTDAQMASNAGGANIHMDVNNFGSSSSGNGIIWKTKYANNAGYTKTSAAIKFQPEGNYFRGGLGFYTNDTQNATTNAVERMRISSGGNVGIGTTPSGYSTNGYVLRLHGGTQTYMAFNNTTHTNQVVGGFVIGNDASSANIIQREDQPIKFYTNNALRLTISSEGAANFAGSVTNAHMMTIVNSKSTPYGIYQRFMSEQNNESSDFIRFQDGTEVKFYVYSNGNVKNKNNSYSAISDVKLKENIVDTPNKLNDILKVKVRNYNFKNDNLKQIGVIAQELESIFPSLVSESPDTEIIDKKVVDLGTTTKSVKYSVFVPILIKAIQEQQTIIEDLKSRIETLEG